MIKIKGTFPGEATLVIFTSTWWSTQEEEFAPLGGNSFP